MFALKFIFVLLLVLNLGSCSQNVSSDLKSHKWEFTAQQHHDSGSIVRFNGKKATFVKGDHSKDYAYRLKKRPDGTTNLIITQKSSVSQRAPTKEFELKKAGQNYKLIPKNKLAKHYYGEVQLISSGKRYRME
ncbi:hypothetical protein LPAF129_14900 [Ligilactobacillus pabuli]|uniref:Lipoprotein n=1 Tax=Ligilactobacillus pabuli TaxID=2886039 RepID=A0ABQ5JI77_9LACO|nr:hypothetical protein [Ligilactobacillus pabuli]GKS81804.1 hypothetical protein LPAF129_14900 [Ligilactobacillus pabuli]